MPISEEQYSNIQEYLDGVMPEDQRQRFLTLLDSDKELKEHFDFEIQLRADMENILEKEEIFSLYKEMSEENNASKSGAVTHIIKIDNTAEKLTRKGKLFIMRPWVMSAAACIVLGIIGLFYFLNAPKNNGDGDLTHQLAALYDSYFEKDTIPHKKYDLLAKAFSDYEKNNYTTIQKYDLENLPNLKGPEDDHKELVLEYGYYYKGIAYLQTKDFPKADSCFQWVIDKAAKEDLQWKAKWYMALSLIKTGDTKKAMQWLEILSADTKAGEYNTKAAALLAKLKKTMAASR